MSTILVHILNATPEVNFYGWDVIKFWCRQVLSRIFTYSWQVRTAYAIVVLCVISVLSLSFIFSGHIRKRRKKDDAYKKCKDRYIEPFRTILKTDYHLPTSSIEKICDCHIEDFAEFEGGIYAKLLCEIRNELSDVISLPNIQLLAELTGVRSWIENNLHKKNDIEIRLYGNIYPDGVLTLTFDTHVIRPTINTADYEEIFFKKLSKEKSLVDGRMWDKGYWTDNQRSSNLLE